MRLPSFRGGVTPVMRRSLLLGLFLAAGMFCGTLSALRLNGDTLAELCAYMDRYGSAVSGALSASAVCGTVWVYFRCGIWCMLFAFCAAGVVLIPLGLAAEGFGLAFSAIAFSSGMGKHGALLALAVFGLRGLILLPCLLYLGCAAWRMALDRKRSLADLTRHGRELCVCVFFLALGAALELTLVPRFLLLTAD